jgi:hypothetical protein
MLFSLFQTLILWGLNPSLWLTEYLNRCATHGGKTPPDAVALLPWNLTEEQRRRFQSRTPQEDDTS